MCIHYLPTFPHLYLKTFKKPYVSPENKLKVLYDCYGTKTISSSERKEKIFDPLFKSLKCENGIF